MLWISCSSLGVVVVAAEADDTNNNEAEADDKENGLKENGSTANGANGRRETEKVKGTKRRRAFLDSLAELAEQGVLTEVSVLV